MNGAQCRAARALLDLSKTELAALASVAMKTITAIEADAPIAQTAAGRRVRSVLVVRGAEFLDHSEDYGVRVRPAHFDSQMPSDQPKDFGITLLPEEIDTANKDMLRPEQCRAARAFLGWTREQAAQALNVGISSLQEFEKSARVPGQLILAKVVVGFATYGVTFSQSNHKLSVYFELDNKT